MKSERIILFCAVVTLFFVPKDAEALTEWKTSEGGNGHFYEVVSVPEGIWWTEAKIAAEDRGGYLATITSQEESDFVYTLIDRNEHFSSGYGFTNTWGPWLGGFQPEGSPEPDGNWQWVTSEPWEFTNWYGPQPGDGGPGDGSENYLSYVWGNNWNDLGNRGAYDGWPEYEAPVPINAYVVEIPEPSTLLLLGIGGLLSRKRGYLIIRRN